MISCLAVDDEPWALALITDYIAKTPFLELKYSSTNVLEVLKYLQQEPVQLIFADIQMPDLNGIQLIQVTDNATRFILTTAYSEYALEGYENNVLDYLLKPITYDRFYKAALKAKIFFECQNAPGNRVETSDRKKEIDYIFVKRDDKIIKIQLADILFIEGLREYVSIQTKTEKFVILESMKALEDGLSNEKFMRVHKSYIVALDKIDAIERNRVFIGKQVIPIGDAYRSNFFNTIENNKYG